MSVTVSRCLQRKGTHVRTYRTVCVHGIKIFRRRRGTNMHGHLHAHTWGHATACILRYGCVGDAKGIMPRCRTLAYAPMRNVCDILERMFLSFPWHLGREHAIDAREHCREPHNFADDGVRWGLGGCGASDHSQACASRHDVVALWCAPSQLRIALLLQRIETLRGTPLNARSTAHLHKLQACSTRCQRCEALRTPPQQPRAPRRQHTQALLLCRPQCMLRSAGRGSAPRALTD